MKACMIAVVVAMGCTVAQAQTSPPPSEPSAPSPAAKRVLIEGSYNSFSRSTLSFLSPGKNYVISFPSNERHFVGTFTRESPNPKRMKELTGHEFEIKKTKLEVFTVVQLNGDSWARVEYPASSADYNQWNGKLNAQAVLADETLAKKLEQDESKEHLRRFRFLAAQPIATRQSWINLDHAIEISDLRTELIFRRLTAGPPVPVPTAGEIEGEPAEATTLDATNEMP